MIIKLWVDLDNLLSWSFLNFFMLKEDNLKKIVEILKKFPKKWDGKKAILEMKDNNYNHWKQMEWIGFYFEFLCDKFLDGLVEPHKIKYGRVSFDGFLDVPFDYKAHAINTESHKVITNGTEEIIKAVEEYGYIVDIIALGEVKYNDIQKTFKTWHDKLKGKISNYEKERIQRGALSRLRKVDFDLKEIILIKVDKGFLDKCGSFQENFRNSDGSKRKAKVMVDLSKLKDEDVLARIEF